MSALEEFVEVPGGSLDRRIHVFRRSLRVVDQLETMNVDAYLVITAHYGIVCDTLLCPDDMAMLVQAMGKELKGRPLLVINSHADWDHCWGNGYFTGANTAPIIAHERCRTRLLSEEARARLQVYQRFPIFRQTVLVPPTITFASTLTLHGGDLTVELFHAPGHRSEHIALWIPELRVLLAFDAAEDPFPQIDSAEAIPSMIATLHRFLALQPQHVLCSHDNTATVATLEGNLAYLRELERRCRLFLLTPRSAEVQIEEPSALIDYPFDAVVSTYHVPIDRAYYHETHNENVRCMMQWLHQAQTTMSPTRHTP